MGHIRIKREKILSILKEIININEIDTPEVTDVTRKRLINKCTKIK